MNRNILFTLIFTLSLQTESAFAFGFFKEKPNENNPNPIEKNIEKKTENTLVNSSDNSEEKEFDGVFYGKYTNEVIIQALNKITAESLNIPAKIREQIIFGKILIEPQKCWQSPPDKRPENKILVKIHQITPEEEIIAEPIFHGWLFSSSPSISSLEHPIYDVIAIKCVDNESEQINEQS